MSADTTPPAGRARDPRLGRWHDVGAFLTTVRVESGKRGRQLYGSDVRGIAGIASQARGTELLDFPGGLAALFEECMRHAEKEGIANG